MQARWLPLLLQSLALNHEELLHYLVVIRRVQQHKNPRGCLFAITRVLASYVIEKSLPGGTPMVRTLLMSAHASPPGCTCI